MTEGDWPSYLGIFGASAFLSLILTPVALRVALRGRVLDMPAEHKHHHSPIPYLGGVAILAAFGVAVVGATLLEPPPDGVRELAYVLGMGFALSLVGLADDLWSLSPIVRLAVEVATGIMLWNLGVSVEMFSGDALDAVVTVVWVVGITNAFNLLDNMDGLSAGVAAIGAMWFFVVAAYNGQFLVAALAIALAGCAVGFLRHNFHPARIYMGDAGSLFLGFVLSYLGLKLRFEGPTAVTFLVPILTLGVAILDTGLVSICRLRAGRSPFQGGLDHLSHRLVFIGLPVRAAVGIVYSAAVALGVIAVVVSRVDRASAYMLAGLVFVLGALVGILLARIPVYRGATAWDAIDAENLHVLTPRNLDDESEPVRNRQARLGSLFGHRQAE